MASAWPQILRCRERQLAGAATVTPVSTLELSWNFARDSHPLGRDEREEEMGDPDARWRRTEDDVRMESILLRNRVEHGIHPEADIPA